MAELIYHVSTDWKEVERLYNEIMKLNSALEKSNTDAPREEIGRLISKLDELKGKYEDIIQTTQQANDKLSDVFSGSSNNPYKGIEDNADQATKTISKSFDEVIGKVCELYDYIKETKDLIGSLTESSDVISKITDCMSELSDETKRQELNLSNQAAQNTNILQQQQAGVMSMTQQNIKAQSLNEAASERAAIEEEVKGSIDDTTATIKKQTTAVNENTEAIKNQKEEMGAEPPKIPSYTDTIKREIEEKTKELQETVKKSLTLPQGSLEWEGAQTRISNLNNEIDELTIKLKKVQGDSYLEELKEDALSIESTIGDLKEGIKGLSENDPAAIQANEIIREKELLLEGLRNKIAELEEKEESLKQKNEELGESGEKFAYFLTFTDEIGKSFVVWGDNAQDARIRAEQAQEVMGKYPEILQQIKEKAKDMYMTSEGDKLVKEAEKIGAKLSEVKSTADMFDRSGTEVGSLRYERLLNILERLGEIDEEEKNIIEEQKKQAELARIQEQEAEQRAIHSGTMRTRIMKAREEMIQLIEEGKKGSAEFMELAEKAGDMREEMQLANAYMSYFDDPNRGLTALKVGLQGVAGAASMVTSVIGIFNEDSKKMMEIQTKVQSILGIVVGLETTYNLVKKTSVFMIAIEEAKTWALAKARGVQAAATTAATAAQEGLNAAMSKTPWGAIVAILVTLGAAIFAVTKALMSETDAEKKAREEKEAHIKAIKEQQESWARSVAESASKQIMSYRKLQDSWNKLGDDMAKKKKFVKDNQKAFNDLGFAVGGVTDAENLLVKNTDAVVESIMARAKALAYQELMTESFKKQIEEQMKADQNNATAKGGQYSYRVKAGGNTTDRRSLAYKNAKEAGYTFMEGDTKDGKWTEQGARRVNQYSSNYAASQRAKAAAEDKKRNKKYEDEQKKLTDKANKELEKEKNKLANANIKTYEPTDKGGKGGGGKTAAELAQERKELMDKQAREQKRAEEDLEISTREARIKAMDESTEKVIERIKLDHDKEVLAIQRSYEDMRIKRIEAAKALWEKDEKNKGKNFFDSDEYKETSSYRDPKEIENRDIRLIAADKQMQQSMESENEKRIQALLDYQKEYGDFQTRRAAITKEYDLKIDKEQDEIQKAALARQKERLISELNMKELQQSLDWETVFNNLEYQSVDALRTLKKQLAQALDAKDITAENAKVLAEKIREIEDNIARRTDVFSSWLPGLRERKRLTQEILEVEQQINGLTTVRNKKGVSQEKAISQFVSAVNKKGANITEGSFRQQWQKIDNGSLDSIKERYKNEIESSESVKKAFEVLETTTYDLSKAEEDLKQAQANQKARQDALKNFTKSGNIGQYFKDVTAGMDATGIFSLINQNAQSANALLGNIGLGNTEFGKGFADFAKGMDGFQKGVQSLMQGDVFGAINGVVDGIQGFGSAIGRAFGINWGGGNEKEVAETTERLTKKNEDLIRAIESLTGIMDKSYGSKALSVYQKALESQEKVNKNNMEILQAQMGYHSSHHSNAYYADDEEIRKYNAAAQEAMRTAGVKVSTVTGLQSIYNLTPEQLKAIRDFAPDLWRYLTEVGKYDKSEYWDAVVEQAGKTEELTERIMEKLTTTTEESVFSDFLNQLYALGDGSQEVFTDISKGWQEMVNKMVINNLVGEKYQDELSRWRQKLYELNKQKQENKDDLMTNDIYKQRLRDLNAEYQDIVKKAQSDINEYKEAGIIASTDNFNQSATAKSMANISYDQANSLVGIGISTQAAVEQSRERLDIINTRFDEMFIHMRESYDVADDSRDILAGMAIHVEEIRDGVVDTLVPRIKNMDSELSRIRKYVEEQ